MKYCMERLRRKRKNRRKDYRKVEKDHDKKEDGIRSNPQCVPVERVLLMTPVERVWNHTK